MDRGSGSSEDAMTTEENKSSPVANAGCGLIGCLGGLVLGVAAGLLIFVFAALGSTVDSGELASTDPNATAVRITLSEAFLTEVVRDATEDDTAQFDLLPDNQFTITGEQTLPLGTVEATGLFRLQLVGQVMEVRLVELEAAGVEAPPGSENIFDNVIADLNRDLNQVSTDLSSDMELGIRVTSLTTSETELIIEAVEVQQQ